MSEFDRLAIELLQTMDDDVQENAPEQLKGEVGCLFQDTSIAAFFKKWQANVREALPPVKDVVKEAERVATIAKGIADIKEVEEEFGKWLKDDNPIGKLMKDLEDRECTPTTISVFKSVANGYSKFCNFDPEFTPDELRAYRKHVKDKGLVDGSRRVHDTVLKLWWEVLGLVWPLAASGRKKRGKRVRGKRPPTFNREQVKDVIKRVKMLGNAQDRYYICLASVWAPRRIELGCIIGENFTWENGAGILEFEPVKGGELRRHHIPAGLVPYLKEYSYEARVIAPSDMTKMLQKMWRRIGFKVPRPADRAPDSQDRVQAKKGFGWHAFRHAVDVELLDAGIDSHVLTDWMGWRTKPGMTGYYYTPEQVDVDKKVLAKHPFLKMWL